MKAGRGYVTESPAGPHLADPDRRRPADGRHRPRCLRIARIEIARCQGRPAGLDRRHRQDCLEHHRRRRLASTTSLCSDGSRGFIRAEIIAEASRERLVADFLADHRAAANYPGSCVAPTSAGSRSAAPSATRSIYGLTEPKPSCSSPTPPAPGASTIPPETAYTWQQYLDEVAAAGYRGTELGPFGFLPKDPALLKDELAQPQPAMIGATHVHTFGDVLSRPVLLQTLRELSPLLVSLGAKHLVIMDESNWYPAGAEGVLDDAGWAGLARTVRDAQALG